MQRVVPKLGQLSLSNSALFICDVQEIFRDLIHNMPSVVQGSNTMLRAAKELNLPTIVTTQYAARFGATMAGVGLEEAMTDQMDIEVFDKTKFSMLTPPVIEKLEKIQQASVILCGIEVGWALQQDVQCHLRRLL